MKYLHLLIFVVKLDVSIWNPWAVPFTLPLHEFLDWIVPNPESFQYLIGLKNSRPNF